MNFSARQIDCYRAVGGGDGADGGVDGGPAHGLGKGDGLRHTPTELKEL